MCYALKLVYAHSNLCVDISSPEATILLFGLSNSEKALSLESVYTVSHTSITSVQGVSQYHHKNIPLPQQIRSNGFRTKKEDLG